jgi:hypothetical protein
MQTKILTVMAMLGFLAIFFTTSCTGIKLENNCGKDVKQTVTVLPFLNDDYNCHKNIEKILEGMCYQVVDGRILLNEYSISTNKNFEEISLEEFCEFVKSRGVDLVVLGDAKVVWHDPPNVYVADFNNNDNAHSKSMYDDWAMKQMIKGNYAAVNCSGYYTQTKEKITIFQNYKVKKISLGEPDIIGITLLSK